MYLAVNYSPVNADLLRGQRIRIDRFKCPAWPELVAEALRTHSVYVHFALKVGLGIGDAIDTETNQRADWRKVETLLEQTDTPCVNLHVVPRASDYPETRSGGADPAFTERIIANTLCDVRSVIARFGAERVTLENDGSISALPATLMPGVIRQVVEEAGCGFLLDVSHARLAAGHLGMDSLAYIAGLPVAHVREIHVTGIQRVDDYWLKRGAQAGLAAKPLQAYAGRLMDHLPMTEADWEFFAWTLAQVRSGAWREPWVVGFEYGGVGGLWEALCDRDVLAAQIPRLYDMVHANGQR